MRWVLCMELGGSHAPGQHALYRYVLSQLVLYPHNGPLVCTSRIGQLTWLCGQPQAGGFCLSFV